MRYSKKDREHNGVLRMRNSKKDREYKGYSECVIQRRTENTMDKSKRTKGKNNVLQNITHKTNDRATLKTRGERRYSGRVSSSYSTSDTL